MFAFDILSELFESLKDLVLKDKGKHGQTSSPLEYFPADAIHVQG